MATILEKAKQTALTSTERTWRATIDTPKGQPYRLTIHREVAITDATDVLVAPTVRDKDYSFTFDQIADKKIAVEGVTLTVAQIAGFCQAAFDALVADEKAKPIVAPPQS